MSAAASPKMTEAERDALASTIAGQAGDVWRHVRTHHFLTSAEIAKAIRLGEPQVAASLASLQRSGLVEQTTVKRGVVWRPAPCIIDETPPVEQPPSPEPTIWLETEFVAALSFAGHPLHASARALAAGALSEMPQELLLELLGEVGSLKAPAEKQDNA